MYAGNNSRWADTIKLLDYGFSQYSSKTPIELYNENPITIETSNYSLTDSQLGKLSLSCTAADEAARNASIVATKEELENLARNLRTTALFQYTRDFVAPIEAGEVMGTMTYLLENGEPVVYNLTATRSVARRENAPPSLDEIRAMTDADPNPLPPLSPEIVFLLALPFLITLGLILLLRRLFIGRKRRPGKGPRVTSRYLR